MLEFSSATRSVLRRSTWTILGLLLAAPLAPAPAQARHHHHLYAHRGRVTLAIRVFGRARPMHVRPGSFTPPFAAFAIDGNSGHVLYARDENAPRHPASITKVMTLYLLFEQLERGHLSLDSRIEVSEHAALQAPTKLGLRPGATIRVEDAVKAIVTKSANDMAVAIAERIGGSEDGFARLMTRKAHALGMSRSYFVNASGLPDDRQITTARDLAMLGRAIHDRYPQYFHFFSTPSFRYAGQFMANHNHLMEQVDGMDGIKTGYTRASGFNLLSSVNRNGHWLISVVLGGKTRLGRDRIMADLIESEIDKCATRRTTPMVAENPELEHVAEAIPVITHEGDAAPPVEGVDDEGAEDGPAPRIAAEPVHPELVHAEPVRAEHVQAEPTSEDDEPIARPVRSKPVAVVETKIASLDAEVPAPRPRPAFVSGLPRATDMTSTGSINRRSERLDGSTARYVGAATATPSTLKHRPQRDRNEAAKEKEKAKPVRVASLDSDVAAPTGRPSSVHGLMIQIGATPTIAQANDLITHAKTESHGALAGARAFTEKVQKGGTTLFRARFAGLEETTADKACRNLKRAGIACFTTKN